MGTLPECDGGFCEATHEFSRSGGLLCYQGALTNIYGDDSEISFTRVDEKWQIVQILKAGAVRWKKLAPLIDVFNDKMQIIFLYTYFQTRVPIHFFNFSIMFM